LTNGWNDDVSQVSERNGVVLLDTPARYCLESAGRFTAESAQCHGGAGTDTGMHADPQLHGSTHSSFDEKGSCAWDRQSPQKVDVFLLPV